MAVEPPSGAGGISLAVAGGLPAGVAVVFLGHLWLGITLAVLVPVIRFVLSDYGREVLGALAEVHAHRIRAVGRVKTEQRVDGLRQDGRMAQVRSQGALQRQRIKQDRRTRRKLARAGGGGLPAAGRPKQLRAVSEEDAPTHDEDTRRPGRHRDVG